MSGYDYSCTTYGPDGRVYQIDYAQKAAESQGLGVAIRVSDGVAMLVQRTFHSPLQEPSSSRVFQMTDNIVATVIGILPDGRALCQNLLSYCDSYEKNYSVTVPIDQLAQKASAFMEQYTHYDAPRPFGCCLFLSDGSQLYYLTPSGDFYNCFAQAAGRKAPNARVELEKLIGEQKIAGQDRFGHLKKSRNDGGDLSKLQLQTALTECAKIMWTVFDEGSDVKWYCEGVVITRAGEVRKVDGEEMTAIVAAAKEQ